MIIQVAEAAFKVWYAGNPENAAQSWRDLPAEMRAPWIRTAKAVIGGMREPTAKMLQAGADAHAGTDMRSEASYAVAVCDVADVWEAMIDESLKE